MATRSTIWYYDEDRKIYRGIYCHWDGYPEGVGITLLNYFNFEEGVKAIVERGACSALYPRLDPIGDWHSFKTPEPGTSVFYHRDRGDSLRIFEARSPLEASEYFQDYDYLWIGDNWYINESSVLDPRPLKEILQKMKKEK